jgi:glycosyltransferase involved in cell wall biosynthesis
MTIAQSKHKLPKISIVTPSYNQGKFIERTIKSVLDQKYPSLEYIVMDGGSTDDTVSILKKYGKQITWVSEKDNGQAHAINKGLKIATGDILAYLNSDDTYQPGSLKRVGDFFDVHSHAYFVYGHGRLIDSKDREVGFYNDSPTDSARLFEQCNISQPTCFWRREVLETVGYFDETYQFTMDYDYWVRVARTYHLYYIRDVLANTRIHPDAKTSAFTHKLHTDALRVVQTHYGSVHYDWIFTFTDSAFLGERDTKAYFRFMARHSLLNFIRYNRAFPTGKALKIILSWFKQS